MLERYNKNSNHGLLLSYVRNPNNERFFRRISSLSGDETFDNLEALLRAQFFFYRNSTYMTLMAEALVGVFNYDPAAGTAEVGCCIGKFVEERGVATQALGELAARLFYGNVFFEKLTATCLAEDTHSRHVLEKTGWVQEGGILERNVYFQGEIKDEVRYRLFREEYEQRYGDRFAYWKKSQLRNQAGDTQRGQVESCVGDTDGVVSNQTTVETESD